MISFIAIFLAFESPDFIFWSSLDILSFTIGLTLGEGSGSGSGSGAGAGFPVGPVGPLATIGNDESSNFLTSFIAFL